MVGAKIEDANAISFIDSLMIPHLQTKGTWMISKMTQMEVETILVHSAVRGEIGRPS